MRRFAAALLFALAACGAASDEAPPPANVAAPTGLEAAAIQAGVIPDPARIDITGLYERESDRVCIVPSATAYRIGVFVDYGDGHSCSGSGEAVRRGETLRLTFADAEGCAFDARFEGDRIVLPGSLPEGCQKLCSQRASLAGLSVDRLSDSASEAATLRNARGRLLCPSDGG